MARIIKDYHPPGTAPGTLPAQPRDTGKTSLFLLDFSAASPTGAEITDVAKLAPEKGMVWLHVIGRGDLSVIERIGQIFNLHPLALEDATHRGQRPKIEDYPNHTFVILQHPFYRPPRVSSAQLSIFFSAHAIVTIQLGCDDDLLAPLRERLLRGAVRTGTPDYLAYTIMDFVVDTAFPLLESMGDAIEALEEQVVSTPERRENIQQIHRMRHNLRQLRRAFWPQRDVFSRMLQSGDEFGFAPATRVYLRDLYDHAVHLLDVLETYREMVSDVNDLYLSGLSLRLNDVIRILTVISTIFIPLTFIVGVYGMNFDRRSPWNMPELGWPYGYLLIWGTMLAIAVGMLAYFRRKGWF